MNLTELLCDLVNGIRQQAELPTIAEEDMDDTILLQTLATHRDAVVMVRPGPSTTSISGAQPPHSIKDIVVEHHDPLDSVGGTTIWIDTEEM